MGHAPVFWRRVRMRSERPGELGLKHHRSGMGRAVRISGRRDWGAPPRATLRANTEAKADDLLDHQFWIDRGPPDLAVERPQVCADAEQVYKPIDRAQQVVGRHVTVEAELAEQRLLRYEH